LQFAKAGLLETTESLLTAILSRNTFSKGKVLPAFRTSSVSSQKALSLGVLALLGERFQNGIVPLRTVMHAIISPDPKAGIDLVADAIAIPIKASLHAAYQALVEASKPHPYPYSREDVREPRFLSAEFKLIISMLESAVNRAKLLWDNYDRLISVNARAMFFPLYYREAGKEDKAVPLSDLPGPYLALVTEIEQFYEMLIGLEMNWEDHPQNLYQQIYMDMNSTLYYEEVQAYLDRVEALEFKLEPYSGPVKPGRTIRESAPILVQMNQILGARKRRWHEGPAYLSVSTL
jgi:hypothetical protein